MKKINLPVLTLSGLCLFCGVPRVLAQPGSGIRLGPSLLLTPEISASYNWNSNVNVRRRALDEGGERLDENDGDTFVSGQASLSLKHWNKSTQTNAKAWYNTQNYAEFTELD